MDTDQPTLGPIPTWSFSRLESFEKCNYLAFLKFKQGEKEGESEKRDKALKRGISVHASAEGYIKGEAEPSKDLKRIQPQLEAAQAAYAAGHGLVEDPWGFDINWTPTGWWDDNIWLRVKLDSLTWHDEERTAALIEDVKTGKKFGNEVKHKQQGQLYAISAFMRYPTLQVAQCRFLYTDEGTSMRPTVYTREQAMLFLPRWNKRGLALTTAQTFKPNPSRISCRYCPFGPTNGNGKCEYGVEA